jgi:PKD repeat protein
MKANLGLKSAVFLLALLAVSIFLSGCRSDQVEVPPLTGDSGHHIFLRIQANPEHLVIRTPGSYRETSRISVQLKNQEGQGVSGENIRLSIVNGAGGQINIGRLDRYSVTTDSGGWAYVTYTAPNSAEQPVGTSVYIYGLLTNSSVAYEVTDIHELVLMAAGPQPGTCVYGTGAIIADFTVDVSAPVVNQSVCFDASSTEATGLIIAAEWNFGDGTTGYGMVACHSFKKAGSFLVTLVVQDQDHNCDQKSQSITVAGGAAPTCSIVVSPSTHNVGEKVYFTAIATDTDGRVVKYDWNFGDGKRGSGANATHVYDVQGSYAVILTVTDDQGNTSTCQTTVSVGVSPPTCSFSASPSAPTIGQTVNFNASASTDDGTIESYLWDYGDGSAAVETPDPFTTHSYNDCGAYSVILLLTDDDGNTSTCQQSVTVTATPPTCSFIPQNPTLTAGVAQVFDASASTGSGLSYSWNFGDGGTDTVVMPNYTFVAAGTYTTTLTVTDKCGQAASCSTTVTVNP